MKHSYSVEFDVFWHTCVNKVAKHDTERAYIKARKQATAEEILDGYARYVQNKPAWQAYCHPATFLRGGRWLDQTVEPPTSGYVPWTCPHGHPCDSQWRCHQRTEMDAMRKSG